MKSKWKIGINKETETLKTRVFNTSLVDGETKYEFRVEVDKDYAFKSLGKEVPELLLVQQSFMFLLDREPATSILRDFNLKEIQKYFPEYESEMKKIF